MGSKVIDIADAVTEELNNPPVGAFTLAFVAARHYRPQFDLAELKVLRVSVVPRGLAISSLSRSINQREVGVDVAVQKKVNPADVAELDGLMALVGQIADYLCLRRLTSMPGAMWVKTENLPIYSPEHLETKQVFTSLLTFTFRVVE